MSSQTSPGTSDNDTNSTGWFRTTKAMSAPSGVEQKPPIVEQEHVSENVSTSADCTRQQSSETLRPRQALDHEQQEQEGHEERRHAWQ